jgi:hypothetical protein
MSRLLRLLFLALRQQFALEASLLAAAILCSRQTILGHFVSAVAGMAASLNHGPARDCHPLASRGFSSYTGNGSRGIGLVWEEDL